jgi:D-glycero-D-manno-heptose 1,7-bisphosphate phosphatase
MPFGSERPNQAVILAGGRGSRLGTLTDERPKPMVLVRGRPFLEYQIEQVRDQGFNRILILLGYMSEVVESYFGDGAKWGVDIQYSVSAAANETLRRLRIAEPLLDDQFLLLYCDNYWPMQIDRMWSRFLAAGVPAMVTVYTNTDGYTRNSVRVDPDGYISVYDSTCTTPGLQGVEVSYALICKSALELSPDTNLSIGDALYTTLARTRELAAYRTDHRYYSIGALHRLSATESFFERRPTVVIDRAVLQDDRAARAGGASAADACQWLSGARARKAFHLLKEAGCRVIVLGGDDVGERTAQDREGGIKRAQTAAGNDIDAVYTCGHHDDADCDCTSTMLIHAQREFNLDLTRTVFIGHHTAAIAGALDALGCPSLLRSSDMFLSEILRDVINVPFDRWTQPGRQLGH